MASSTISSMMDLSAKYCQGDDSKKHTKAMAADAENTDQEFHLCNEIFKRMDPEVYLARVESKFFSGIDNEEDNTADQEVTLDRGDALMDKHYQKAKNGDRPKYSEHLDLYQQMRNPEISPCGAREEIMQKIVDIGPKFIYTMGCEYCGLRDEGLIYMERLRELSDNNKERYFYTTAKGTIHGWLSGSTSYGNGEPEPTGNSKMDQNRRQWNKLCNEWAERIEERIYMRAFEDGEEYGDHPEDEKHSSASSSDEE